MRGIDERSRTAARGNPERAGAVHLLLTTACNLRCNYCYQERRPVREMDWSTLRRALDWSMDRTVSTRRILFSGGEPLLALPLIRRAVRYAEKVRKPYPAVRWAVQTNGLLLDVTALDFLADHGFDIHLSFDGVASAQGARGKGTFERLDRVLREFRSRHPEAFREHLTVLMTVAPGTAGQMADSFAYFLAMGVENLSMSPVHVPGGEWPRARCGELEEPFERIGALSLLHLRSRGAIPLLPLRSETGSPPHPWRSRTMCGVMQGRSVAVDVDGSVYGCAMLIERGVAGTSPWLARELSRLRIGQIADASLEAALEGFVEKAQGSAILTQKEKKRSSIARCATCRAIGDCDLCPVSIGLIPGNDDPDHVPEFACAFYRAAHRMKERFLREMAMVAG